MDFQLFSFLDYMIYLKPLNPSKALFFITGRRISLTCGYWYCLYHASKSATSLFVYATGGREHSKFLPKLPAKLVICIDLWLIIIKRHSMIYFPNFTISWYSFGQFVSCKPLNWIQISWENSSSSGIGLCVHWFSVQWKML